MLWRLSHIGATVILLNYLFVNRRNLTTVEFTVTVEQRPTKNKNSKSAVYECMSLLASAEETYKMLIEVHECSQKRSSEVRGKGNANNQRGLMMQIRC